MRHILTGFALIILSLASVAAETKKEITVRQIIGTWKHDQYIEKDRHEATRIYSPSGKYYLMTRTVSADGSVTRNYTQTGTYNIDNDGNLVEVTEPDNSKNEAVVDWLDQNTVVLRFTGVGPLEWKRSQ